MLIEPCLPGTTLSSILSIDSSLFFGTLNISLIVARCSGMEMCAIEAKTLENPSRKITVSGSRSFDVVQPDSLEIDGEVDLTIVGSFAMANEKVTEHSVVNKPFLIKPIILNIPMN